MALLGKENIIAHVRSIGYVYWKIYQDATKKTAGNFVGTADFANENLGLENSLDSLRQLMDRMTPGQYILTCYKNAKDTRGGIETTIEIGGSSTAAISGVNTPASFAIEGFGTVSSDNFNDAITFKIKQHLDEEKRKTDHEKLVKENAELKKQLKENESGFQRGVISIGSFLYSHIAKSDAGKEFIGMVRDVMAASRGSKPAAAAAAAPGDGEFTEAEVISGTGTSDEERLLKAVEKLSKDNPDFLEQIELMAKVKQEDPDTFNEGVEALKTIAG